jgi:D-alanyl-D-alanine carboxypeptidase/D-alanyl-D-alanine-endopeptidase (penicillin-binding protein 4)
MRFRKAGLVTGVFFVGVALVFFTFHRSTSFAREDKLTSAPSSSPVASANIPPATDAALGQKTDRLIDESDLRPARCGVFVMSEKDGRVLYSRDSDKLFTPASNMKVYTTAVALDLLGADYRWRTSVYANKQPDPQGVIDGDLTLYGRGAPDLVSKAKGDAPSLARFADQLYESGVREVRGNIIGDESYFRGEMFGVGWQWNDLQWYYGAQPSALSVDENTFEVTMGPANKQGSGARVVMNPDDNFIHLTNNATTGERDAAATIGLIRELSTNDVRVWGEFPISGQAFSAFLSVDHPALWAATIFRRALIARGIKITGEFRSRDFRAAETEKFDPQKAIELAYQDSEPLGEIVRKTNKESNNLFAELILRTIGKERGSTAPDPDPRKNRARGDDEAGVAVVRSWLEQKGIAARDLALRDGSGLSRLDLITPESTARLLYAVSRTNVATTFHDSLPVSGRDGTLSGRLKNALGQISAKTGSLTYVHALSGYASTRSGEVLVFSIMCNDTTSDRKALALIDRVAVAITNFGPPSPGK